MFKKIISYIAAAVSIIAAFVFSGHLNRQRLSRDNESIDGIRDGIEESKRIGKEIASGIDTAQNLTTDIGQDNRTASERVRTAKEILERAKKRTDEGKNL